jgi:hypothetical protein
MAIATGRTHTGSGLRLPGRLLVGGLALAVVAGTSYVVFAGNPLGRGEQAPSFQTVTLSQGPLRVTVSASGPITNPQSVPLAFITEQDDNVVLVPNSALAYAQSQTSRPARTAASAVYLLRDGVLVQATVFWPSLLPV